MKTRRRNVSEDPVVLTISRRNTKSETSMNRIEYSDPIPVDLIMEIFSRLPAKSVTRFRCVSKLWDSLFPRQYFTELFLTRSSARPHLLFMCKEFRQVVFFSSPQPQDQDDNLSHVVANYHMKFSFDFHYSHCGGLVCFIDKPILKRKAETVLVVCNPSTGPLTLPRVKTIRVGVSCYFGYDPVEKQYKVLSMTCPIDGISRSYEEHQVLTLGTGNMSWRRIKCCIQHYSDDKGICINGVLYYQATLSSLRTNVIICFDIRSEKFSFLKTSRRMDKGILVNDNGKLGVIVCEMCGHVYGSPKSFQLWVLEDAEKQEWSEHTYVFPALWNNLVGNICLRFVGVTRSSNEIVLSPHKYGQKSWNPRKEIVPFYVFYYNIERNTVRRVGIQGMEAFKGNEVYTFLDHV